MKVCGAGELAFFCSCDDNASSSTKCHPLFEGVGNEVGVFLPDNIIELTPVTPLNSGSRL